MDDNFYMDDLLEAPPLAEMRLEVKRLLLRCPEEEPMPDCPLNGLRERSLAEKLEAVDMLPFQEIEDLLRHHQECLGSRSS